MASGKKRKKRKEQPPYSVHGAALFARRHADIAAHLGMSLSTVNNWAKQGMPEREGKHGFDLGKIMRWLRSTGPWRQHATAENEDDPLLAVGDSPALERYRLAKAMQAEYDLAEKQKQLFSRDKLRGILTRWASIWRRLGERMEKRFGREAAATVTDAIDECQSVIDHDLASGNGSSAGHDAA